MTMNGKAVIIALSILALAATAVTASDTKKKQKDAKPVAEPTQQVVEPVRPPDNRAGANECWTDEGYGRRLPCSFGGR
jgi:hypothetical protein